MISNTETKPYLKIKNLTKRFGEFTALNDISLDIFESEFVCFLGPSGCGKTTLLRAIAGLDIQTMGSIEQNGDDISALPPAERDFGIVFQSYALFPNLTVNKNVAYGLENRKLPKSKIKARVEELLKLVSLPEQGTKYPAQLSGGQQQRIALARALATSPGLLLLDEPLSALDARVRDHLRSEIKSLQRRLGVTTIMVTHDQEEALTMADRIVVMDNGLIEQVGTPEDIYGQPNTAFVADFIGTMNFIPGTITGPGTLTIGPSTLKCDTEKFSTGDRITVAIRPEDINAQDITTNDYNVVGAEIIDLEFMGSYYRATLGGEAFANSVVHADFSVNLVRRKSITIGSKLPVRLPDDFIQVYKVNGAQ
jgi:iron(III) transport system ATP-binding protein